MRSLAALLLAVPASSQELFLARPSPLATCDFNLTSGLRVDGNDLHSEPSEASSADACCALCTAEPDCGAFVFVASKSICWLKATASGARHQDSDCVAGARLGCISDVDCNMAGRCEAGRCSCEAAWTGDSCERLHLGDAYRCGEGGLCLDGSADFVASWGGNVVRSPTDGSYHMYAASFAQNGTLGVWLTQSRVVHASASKPEGPYGFHDVALGALDNETAWDGLTQHNPEAVLAPDGTYLLYYLGSQREATSDLPGVHDANYSCPLKPGDASETVCMQRVGLASASSPAGPWRRLHAPVLDAGPAGGWDDLFTTNPTPWMFANGSVLLIYKARSRSHPNYMSTGAAFAEHWAGPYVRRSGTPIELPHNCEDAGIYQSADSGVFRMVLHCGCDYQSVWSLDGVSWQATAAPEPWCEVSYSDGGSVKLSRRERPKWLLDGQGRPTHLITGVQPPSSVHGGQAFTLIQELL